MYTTASAIFAEIQKHENYLALVDAGLATCSQSTRLKHIQYVEQLKQDLKQIEPVEDISHLSNEELLAELGIFA